jgi:hypothetical protein
MTAGAPRMAYLKPDAREADRQIAEWVNPDRLRRGTTLTQPWTDYVDGRQRGQAFV